MYKNMKISRFCNYAHWGSVSPIQRSKGREPGVLDEK